METIAAKLSHGTAGLSAIHFSGESEQAFLLRKSLSPAGADEKESAIHSRKRPLRQLVTPEGFSSGWSQLGNIFGGDTHKRQRTEGGGHTDSDESLAGLSFQEKCKYLLGRARHHGLVGAFDRGRKLYARVLEEVEACERKVEEEDPSRDKHAAIELKNRAMYGDLLLSIYEWERLSLKGRHASTTTIMEAKTMDALRNDLHSQVVAGVPVVTKQIFDVLERVGPTKDKETLAVILAFFFNTKQWSIPHTPSLTQEEPLSPMTRYCAKVEEIELAILEKERQTLQMPIPQHPRAAAAKEPMGHGPQGAAATEQAQQPAPRFEPSEDPSQFLYLLEAAQLLAELTKLCEAYLNNFILDAFKERKAHLGEVKEVGQEKEPELAKQQPAVVPPDRDKGKEKLTEQQQARERLTSSPVPPTAMEVDTPPSFSVDHVPLAQGSEHPPSQQQSTRKSPSQHAAPPVQNKISEGISKMLDKLLSFLVAEQTSQREHRALIEACIVFFVCPTNSVLIPLFIFSGHLMKVCWVASGIRCVWRL